MEKKETQCIKCKRTILSLVGYLICDECNRDFEAKRKDK